MSTPFNNSTLPGTTGAQQPAGTATADPRAVGGIVPGAAQPVSRKERRAALDTDSRTGPNLRRPKFTETDHERLVAKIKREQLARGDRNDAPADDGAESTESAEGASDGVLRTGWNALRGGLESLGNAAAGLVPAFVGADAADSCDWNSDCDLGTSIPLSKLEDYAKQHGYAISMSPSLMERKDRSLYGVVVLIADFDHKDDTYHEEMAQLVSAFIRPGDDKSMGDKLLVEGHASDEIIIKKCKGQKLLTTCIPSENSDLVAGISKADSNLETAAAEVILRLRTLGMSQRPKNFKLSACLTFIHEFRPTIETQYGGAVKDVLKDFDKAEAAFHHAIIKANPLREAHYLKTIGEHFHESIQIFFVSGAEHIANIKAAVFARYPALLLYSKKKHATLGPGNAFDLARLD